MNSVKSYRPITPGERAPRWATSLCQSPIQSGELHPGLPDWGQIFPPNLPDWAGKSGPNLATLACIMCQTLQWNHGAGKPGEFASIQVTFRGLEMSLLLLLN